MGCVICDLVARRIPQWVIHETGGVICFLPLELNSYGHTIIAPRNHYADLYDIPETHLHELMTVAKRLAEHYKQQIGATGVNVLHASGPDAQQSVPHFHLHLLPRFPEDELDAWPELPNQVLDKDALQQKLRMT